VKYRSHESEQARLRIIVKWLDAPDQGRNLARARAKTARRPTGTWFLTSPKFQEWKSSSSSWLWLWGVAGCGKTVLNSSVVCALQNELMERPSSRSAVIYFYFDFRDQQKIKASDMIASLIRQLCSMNQESADIINVLYTSKCEEGTTRPTIEQLKSTFQEMLSKFEKVFLVIDALDESSERLQLMETLAEISGWQAASLNVLITSRREGGINDTLEDVIQNDEARIPIREENTNEDIDTWMQEQLQAPLGKLYKKFKKWHDPQDPKKTPKRIMEEITEKLKQQASGM